jgi:hypothetical protein
VFKLTGKADGKAMCFDLPRNYSVDNKSAKKLEGKPQIPKTERKSSYVYKCRG